MTPLDESVAQPAPSDASEAPDAILVRPSADEAIGSSIATGEPLPYPASPEAFRELVGAARSRQKAALRLLVDATGLTIAEISRRVVAANPGISSNLGLSNLLSGNTMANAERAGALAAFFGRERSSIAPHLTAMPWFSWPDRVRWLAPLSGLRWSEIVARGWDRPDADLRDVPRSGDPQQPLVFLAEGRGGFDPDVMVCVSMVEGRARLFYRGVSTARRADAIEVFLRERSRDPADVIERRPSIGRVMVRVDVMLDPKDAPIALGLIGGPLPPVHRRGGVR